MEILTILPFGPFGGCQTWKEYQPALENRNVLFLHQRWASKKRVNRKGKLNVPRLYIVSLAKVTCWFWKRTDVAKCTLFLYQCSGRISKKRVNRKGTCPISQMNQKHWWCKSKIDNRQKHLLTLSAPAYLSLSSNRGANCAPLILEGWVALEYKSFWN